MASIEDFLKPGAVQKLQEIIQSAQQECEMLFKMRDTKKNNKKKDGMGEKKDSAKYKLEASSQKLVMDLVKCMESLQLLKDGVFAENLKYGGVCETDNIVSW